MNLRWLHAYRAVMALGTTTAAARHLHVTQPAISRMLSNLEELTGIELFNREHGRLVPTAEGEAFYRETEHLLNGVSEFLEVARDIRTHRGRRLRVVAMASLVSGLLPDVLHEIRALIPDLRVAVDTRERRDVERWVASQQFDIGIANLPIDNPSVTTMEFASAPAVAVLPVSLQLAQQERVTIADLTEHPLVSLRQGSWIREHVDGVFRSNGLAPRIQLETTSMSVASLMVSRGLGVTVADRFAIRAIDQSRIVIRPLDPPIVFHYGFLFPANRPVDGVTKKFADTVTATAQAILVDDRQLD